MALREKASRLESELGRETELRGGAEKLAGELQTSLARESERAEDLKVCSSFILVLCRIRFLFDSDSGSLAYFGWFLRIDSRIET